MSIEDLKKGVVECCGCASYLLVKNGINKDDADKIVEQIVYASILQGHAMRAEAMELEGTKW